MKREITFRIWDGTSFYFASAHDLLDGYPSEHKCLNRDLIFQQFTGVEDKNGIGIYEGDLVESDDGVGGRMYGEVIYDSEYGTFRLVFTDILQWTFYKVGNPEIIGNVIENPELLKRC